MSCSYCVEQYIWCVYYMDGSIVTECPGNGAEHWGFGVVDKTRVAALEWQPLVADRAPVRMIIPGDTTPTLFRRRLVQLFTPDGPARLPSIHALGWQSKAGDVYLFVLPDGVVLATTELNAV